MQVGEIIVGLRYVVTQKSKDGTFQKGDHILLLEDGDILCCQAGGWIRKEDVPEAIDGMKIKVDTEWYKHEKEVLQNTIEKITKLIDLCEKDID